MPFVFDSIFARGRRRDHPGWPETAGPVTTCHNDEIMLRPITGDDGDWWRATRVKQEARLRPVEPTVPQGWLRAHTPAAWREHCRLLRDSARDGVTVPFVIVVNGDRAGELTLGSISHGSISECWIGYWVAAEFTGRHVATVATALGTDHAFTRVGLHRVTATYLPDNPASGAVLRRNGFREEGFLLSDININGRWRDHHLMALTEDELHGGCVGFLEQAGLIVDSAP
ncbi:GNAT family N-acetyltransferase [Corynebacterium mendelii]|uniref:GNAT family N-acetyltransferase n=1 Tax=Corynebacterium mendelii TaxID=2765362 RepID=A0A939IXQ5_9CORY|nr:GNAT family protein [Corynebacterium mendelii]MBN9644720.1 GNAT family N-acetyltransferase [Corynebacterium mendelii]